eukprot:1140961-Pelagomonas_calceolata.AAC.7
MRACNNVSANLDALPRMERKPEGGNSLQPLCCEGFFKSKIIIFVVYFCHAFTFCTAAAAVIN